MTDGSDEVINYGDIEEIDEISPPYFDIDSEEWVLAGDALRETIELYVAASAGDREAAVKSALAAIRRRLDNGEIVARARRWSYTVDYGNVEPGLEQYLDRSVSSNRDTDVIFNGFWWALEQAERKINEGYDEPWPEEHSALLDWVAGDFKFRSWVAVQQGPIKSMIVEGEARGVCFNRSGLPTFNRFCGPQPAPPKAPRQSAISPNLPQAALIGWWNSLSSETKELPAEQMLLPMCRAAFPNHTVSRARIRELTGPRKRGPRPISGKVTA